MANDLSAYNPTIWAQESLIVLENNVVMGALVHRAFENVPQEVGNIVNTRKPGTFTAQDKGATADITIQDSSATNVAITLNKHKDVSFQVFDIEATKSFKDVIEEMIEPAMIALAQVVDTDLMALYASLTSANSVDLSGSPADIPGIAKVGKKLNDLKVPFGLLRHFVVGTQSQSELVQIKAFHEVDKRGDTEGLKESSIGRKFGFNFWMDQNVAQTGTTPDLIDHGMAFHRNGLALVTRPIRTAVPPENIGGGTVAILQNRGLGIRVALGWDIKAKSVIASLDMLYGVKVLDANLAIEVKLAGE